MMRRDPSNGKANNGIKTYANVPLILQHISIWGTRARISSFNKTLIWASQTAWGDIIAVQVPSNSREVELGQLGTRILVIAFPRLLKATRKCHLVINLTPSNVCLVLSYRAAETSINPVFWETFFHPKIHVFVHFRRLEGEPITRSILRPKWGRV